MSILFSRRRVAFPVAIRRYFLGSPNRPFLVLGFNLLFCGLTGSAQENGTTSITFDQIHRTVTTERLKLFAGEFVGSGKMQVAGEKSVHKIEVEGRFDDSLKSSFFKLTRPDHHDANRQFDSTAKVWLHSRSAEASFFFAAGLDRGRIEVRSSAAVDSPGLIGSHALQDVRTFGLLASHQFFEGIGISDALASWAGPAMVEVDKESPLVIRRFRPKLRQRLSFFISPSSGHSIHRVIVENGTVREGEFTLRSEGASEATIQQLEDEGIDVASVYPNIQAEHEIRWESREDVWYPAEVAVTSTTLPYGNNDPERGAVC